MGGYTMTHQNVVEHELQVCKNETIKIAEQLMYPEETVRKIQKATSVVQISNIMKQARLNSCEGRSINRRKNIRSNEN